MRFCRWAKSAEAAQYTAFAAALLRLMREWRRIFRGSVEM
jgi:hypothetical protein